MGEVPAKIVTRGDEFRARQHILDGRRVMAMLERFMDFQGLKQGVLRRMVSPGCYIECTKEFGLRTINIYFEPGEPGGKLKKIIECFANATCALGYVIEVVGVIPSEDEETCTEEPVCLTCIAPGSYPDEYYCTRDIRYNVIVCDGQGDYLLFEDVASTDFTPRCPEEQVIVMFNRTTDLPEAQRTAADSSPWAKRPFTRPLLRLEIERISILPFLANMPKRRETQLR